MKKLHFLPLFLLPFILLGCGQNKSQDDTETDTQSETGSETETKTETSTSETSPYRTYDPIKTKAISNLSEDFIFGMDASCVPALEKSRISFVNENNEVEDVYKILADHGINYIRVRVWNDPYDSLHRGYGGGNCDINNALVIGKRANKYGMKLLIDFHYSDFWADPKIQKAPKAWESLSFEDKSSALYTYTKESLELLKNENIDVGMIQVGNETNAKMCGETTWENVVGLMKQGSKACREVYPNALVAVHFTNPEKGRFPSYAGYLNTYGLDYDVFGTSYYPYWHGTLDNLSSTLSSVANTYNKKTMVMETSYAFTYNDSDYHGNTSPQGSDVTPHEISIQGQYDQVYDVIDTVVNNTKNGIGVCYWEGTWIGVNAGSWEGNMKFWQRDGSGWATSYAYDYQPDNVGTWYGGTAVDNQAFFDEMGKVLPSLDIFKQERKHSDIPAELLQNTGFEENLEHWEKEILTDGKDDIETYRVWSQSKYDGASSLNIYDSLPIHLRIKQTVTEVKTGSHTFKMAVMGACDSYELKLYAKENNQDIKTTTVTLTGWENWSLFELTFENKTTTVEVGIDVNFKDSGGWAYIDAASLKLKNAQTGIFNL